jgi:hypothetical protein
MRKLFLLPLLLIAGLARADLISGTVGATGGGSSGTSALAVDFNGTQITSPTQPVNFSGQNVVVSASGNQANVAIGDFQSPTSVASAYTAKSTDTLILANATTANNSSLVITLPANSTSKGQYITISKVDTTTNPVTINGAGADVIAGTGTVTLNAFMQTDAMIADGAGHWLPWGQGIEITPSVLGLSQEGTSTALMSASSDTVVCPFFVNVPVAVTGFRTFSVTCSGASSGFSNFAVYDQFGNLRVSSSSVVCPGSAAWQVTLATPVDLAPGQYYVGMQIDNAATKVAGLGPNGGNGATTCSRQTSTTGILPNPFTFGTTDLATPAVFVQVAGGKTGI